MGLRIVYGPGGYNPAKPNNNVITQEAVPDPPLTTDVQTQLSAIQDVIQNTTSTTLPQFVQALRQAIQSTK